MTEPKTTGTDVTVSNAATPVPAIAQEKTRSELYAEQIEAMVAAQGAAMGPIIEGYTYISIPSEPRVIKAAVGRVELVGNTLVKAGRSRDTKAVIDDPVASGANIFSPPKERTAATDARIIARATPKGETPGI